MLGAMKTRVWRSGSIASLLFVLAHLPQAHGDPIVYASNVVSVSADFGKGIDYGSEALACVIIGREKKEDPSGACDNKYGPISSNSSRSAFLQDDGNFASADASLFDEPIIPEIPLQVSVSPRAIWYPPKYWSIFALAGAETETDKFVLAKAALRDPIVISDPSDEAFDVTLRRTLDFLQFSGSAVATETATASYHTEMSTDLTGFLFSLDLAFEIDSPLVVDVNLGSYVLGLPDWDEATIESKLSSLLDAENPGNSFALSDSYSFPDIPINVVAGDILTVSTSDTVVAMAVPEPSALLLFGIGLAATFIVNGRCQPSHVLSGA